jgi:hypothetical protein
MKKILSLALGILLLVSACTEKDKEPILAPGAAPSISSPSGGTAYVLTDSTTSDLFAEFTWTAADFGFDAGVNYTLELDKAGNNFEEAVTVGSVNALKLSSITQGQINNILLTKDLPGDVESDVEFRLVAKLSSDPSLPSLVSQPITLKIRPFSVVIVYPQLQVPGSYQGWDPANNTTVIFSARSDEKYEGYIYYGEADAKYKFTKGITWDTNWGDNGADGTLEPGGADIALANGVGMYRLNVDLNALSHTALKTNWGLIGSATPNGWDSDQDMVYDAVSNTLKITLDLIVGEIKFRANDEWAIDLGDNDANKKLEYGGANIAIAEAGNYTVELNLSGAVYTYSLTKN